MAARPPEYRLQVRGPTGEIGRWLKNHNEEHWLDQGNMGRKVKVSNLGAGKVFTPKLSGKYWFALDV